VKKIALGALLVAVVTVAAWAGADPGPLSAREYRAQLTEICTDLTAKYEAIGEPKSLDELGDTASQLIAAFDNALVAVQLLRPPAELKESADRFVAVSAKIRHGLDGFEEAAKKKDLARLTRFDTKLAPLDKESDEIAKELGVPACAS